MTSVKLIHSGWLSAPNGANTVMNALLNSKEQFQKNGIVMTSLSPDSYAPRSFSKEAQLSGRAIWRARLKRWLKTATKYSRIASDLMIYFTEIRPAKKIAKMYVDSNPDPNEVVFFHSLVPCYFFLKNSKQSHHSVVVCHTNGDNYKMQRLYFPTLSQSLAYKKLQRIEAFVLENVERINFVSDYSMNNFLHLHPEIDQEKVSFIYNGIKDEIIDKKKNNIHGVLEICCVASISKRKGQHYIVDALKMFKKNEIPNIHFTFVGEGPDRAFLEAQVCQARLRNYVSFVGISNQVDKYLNSSNIFILPSEDEGLPMAIIEAMRSSLPIVSTPVGGIPEMINDGVNGLLIHPKANEIFDLLKNITSYDWASMGLNARRTFEEKFTLDKMVESYSKLLCFN